MTTLATAAARPRVLGRMGSLTVRLAQNAGEVEAAQRLRFSVFGHGAPNLEPPALDPSGLDGLDADSFDDLCDHLLVLDEASGAAVATYRLLPADRLVPGERFYSQGEFALAPLLRRHAGARFLELGRSCVAPTHRDRRTLELLWHGTWAYAVERRIDVMFGCASLPGTDAGLHAPALAFLRAHARAEPDWRVRAVPGRGVPMDGEADPRALRALPPLLKGYLRLGACIGEEAVVDHAFGTTDVLVLLRRESISRRYLAHYGADASRFAV